MILYWNMTDHWKIVEHEAPFRSSQTHGLKHETEYTGWRGWVSNMLLLEIAESCWKNKYHELLTGMSCSLSVPVLLSNQTEWRHPCFPLMSRQSQIPVLQTLHHAVPENSKLLTKVFNDPGITPCTYWKQQITVKSIQQSLSQRS